MKYDLTAERAAYNVLKSVFIDKAYSSIELDRALTGVPDDYRARTTALVYGVLEKSVTLDYYISQLAAKKPKNNIEVLLKLAIYDLVYGSSQDYAVIDKFVEFAKDRFSGAQNFVNAVLRKTKTIKLPGGNDPRALSVRYACPEWVIRRLLSDYGDRAYAIIAAVPEKLTHIRYNSRVASKEVFEKRLEETEKPLEKSDYGYYVKRDTLKSLPENMFTAQSLASMRAVNKYLEGLTEHLKVLDLCAAPGGKSIYIEELADAQVTACDVHKHRVELIKSYAMRMGSKVAAVTCDATEYNEAWADAFDLVICDVPCSGSGLLKSSPDILLFKSDKDIAELTKLQLSILLMAQKYVKKGGTLVYSTCSLFKAENEGVADRLTGGFETRDYTHYYPDTEGCDGFFIARWIKTE